MLLRLKILILLVLLMIIVSLESLSGITYYVSPTGNDSLTIDQACNRETPWKTIQKAAQIITAGDSLIIMEGVYYETDIEFIHSGTENAWIVIMAEKGSHPILTGNGIAGIIIFGDKNNPYTKSHFFINGLTLTGYQNDGLKIFYADYIFMSNIHAYANGNAGINVVDSDHILVQDSELHHNGWNSVGDSGWGDGLTINNHKAIGNISIIRRNTMYANWQKRPGSYWDGNGCTLDMAGDDGIHIVANNIFFNNGGTGLLAGDTGSLICIHNVSFRNMSDPGCRNTADFYLVRTGVHDVKLKNNVIYSRPGIWTINRFEGIDDALIENNLIWSQDGSNPRIWWLDWKVVRMEYWIKNRAPSTLKGDPGFVSAPDDDELTAFHDSKWIDMNVDEYDFHLNRNSQCIDQGAFLTKTVSEGSGKEVTVETAHYFTDGFGLEGQGDIIQIGKNSPTMIVGIDYDQNKLTVDQPISWNTGDPVSFPYNGRAPDVGAFEFDESQIAIDEDSELFATIVMGESSMIGERAAEVIMKTSKKIMQLPGPLTLVMQNNSEIEIPLEGFLPGDTFTGTIHLTDEISEGLAYFRLPEQNLVGADGQTHNFISHSDTIKIDLTQFLNNLQN